VLVVKIKFLESESTKR